MTEGKTAVLILICLSLSRGLAALNCTSPTPEALLEALEKELFSRNLLRPVKSFSDTMNISISMTLTAILAVNEKAQSLTTFFWQIAEWDIQGLSWDENECGTTRVAILREKLWMPDIIISEFMEEDTSPKLPYVYLYNTGRVVDDKPVRVVSSCKLEIFTFPFDVQNCSLTFGPYLHFAEEIRMFTRMTAAEILEESRQVMQTRGEWELVDIQAALNTLDISEGSYSEVKYYIILRRRPLLYVVNLLIPSCFLVTVDLISFLLPPQTVDRSAFKMTLILGYTVFLLTMNDLLPVTGESAPLMNVLFSLSLALMMASLMETVFITNIQSSSSRYSTVPHWLSVLVLQYIAVVVLLPPKKKSNRTTVSLPSSGNRNTVSSQDLQKISYKASQDPVLDELKKLSRDLGAIRLHMDKQSQGSNSSEEWQKIGAVIDRLLFGLYIIFIAVAFITIILLWSGTYTV